MAVNETVIAMLRPKPNVAGLAKDPAEVRVAAQAAVDGPVGTGTIASFWTEVPLPAAGTWNAPGKGGAQAGIVLPPRRTVRRCCSSRRQLPRDRRGARRQTCGSATPAREAVPRLPGLARPRTPPPHLRRPGP
ncbi:hypothetical protein ACH414_33120 [Streptomyces sp. NPDC020422]|uniref:hypothetical protein n=1 Tax=Streptomyces sp. NPDC020422 TaxID=3365074 RepID=UPI0037A52C85